MAARREIYWSKQAVRDMIAIGRRVAVDSPERAKSLMQRIAARAEPLAAYPQLGRAGVKAGTRELVAHPHYLVIYRVLPGRIDILRVKHSARKAPE